MRITQVAGLPVGKSSLVPKTPGKRKGKTKGTWTETPEEAEARVTRRRQGWSIAVRHIAQERRGLAIVYKDIEDDLPADRRHRDRALRRHRGHRRLGRRRGRGHHRPAVAQPGRHRAYGGRHHRLAGRRRSHDRTMAAGRAHRAFPQCRVYGEPEAEMIRQAVTEAAIEQAVGRVRGVNRTAANPVEVFVVLSDIVVPGMPVEEAVDFSCIEPDASTI